MQADDLRDAIHRMDDTHCIEIEYPKQSISSAFSYLCFICINPHGGQRR